MNCSMAVFRCKAFSLVNHYSFSNVYNHILHCAIYMISTLKTTQALARFARSRLACPFIRDRTLKFFSSLSFSNGNLKIKKMKLFSQVPEVADCIQDNHNLEIGVLKIKNFDI